MKIIFLAMAPSQNGQGGSDIFGTVIMFALIIFIFYFLILRPQQKKQKERQKLLEALKKGDKVITAGGMHGTIVGMDDKGKTVLVQVADNVKLTIEKASISVINKVGEVDTPTT
ncbi:MAG: preprotein translocase subunit YajC [Bacteroidota bacterium]|nr:preprotein translocase subunit YajC [Bacteroidota bacterium]